MEKNIKKDYKVTTSNDNGLKKATIQLSNNLSLDQLSEIKLLMVQNLDKFNDFEIRIADVESIDLGIIQLLYSFKWTVERKSKKVRFNFLLSDEHKILLEHAGFTEFVNSNQ